MGDMMKTKSHFQFLILVLIMLMVALVSCGPATPVPTVTPTLALTATRTPTLAPTSSRIPGATATSFPKLTELTTLGKGILPQILRSADGQKIFLSDGYSLRILNATDESEIGTVPLSEDGYGYIATVSPDGSMVVTGGLFGGFQVMDVATQKELASSNGGIGGAVGEVFTPDGKYLAYRSADRTTGGSYHGIFLLDIEKNENVFENGYPTIDYELSRYDVMTDPAISPDGKWIAAGYSDSTNNILYIWDLMKGTIEYEIKEQPGRINSVVFSPDGSTLMTAGDDGLIRLWNRVTGKIKRSIPAFTDNIEYVDFAADGRQLLVSVADQPRVTYGLDTGKILPAPPEPLDPLAVRMLKEGYLKRGSGSKVLFSADGKTLVVGHGSLQVWDVQTRRLRMVLSPNENLSLAGLAFSRDGNHLAAVTRDGSVYVWDIRSGQQEFFVSASTLFGGQVYLAIGGSGIGPGIGAGAYGEQGVAFSPDANQIALANGLAVEIWDIKSVSKLLTLEQTNPASYPTKLSFSPDGKTIYAALNRNRDLAVWDAKTGALLRQLNLPKVDPNVHTATDLSGGWFARNNYLVNEYWIEVWNIETGQLTKLRTPQNIVEPLRFSPDGKFLAALVNNHQLYLWRVDTGQLVFVSDDDFEFGDLAISPDAKFLLTASFGKISLWDLWIYSKVAFQPGFVPMDMPPTSTSMAQINSSYHTPTPQPTQIVQTLPLPTAHAGAINLQNAPALRSLVKIGRGQVGRVSWSKDGQSFWISSSHGFYHLDGQSLKVIDELISQPGLWAMDGHAFPDGNQILTGVSIDGKVVVVDQKGVLVEFPGGGQPVISPDGRWLVYADGQNGLKTWNFETGSGKVLFGELPAWSVFSPDGRLVAAILIDHSIRVWDLETGVIVNAVGGPEAPITDLAFSADGSYLLGAAGGSAWVWSMVPGLPPQKITLYQGVINRNLTNFTNTVTSVTLSADGSLLAVGTSEHTIWLYNRKTGKNLGVLDCLGSSPKKMTFSPDSARLLSVDSDGQITLWDVAEQKLIVTSHEFSGSNSGLATRLDGDVSVWAKNTVWTFDASNGDIKHITSIRAEKILAVSPAGDLVAGYSPLKVSLYDATTGELTLTLPEEAQDVWVEYYWERDIIRQFYGALFSPDGKRLATFGTGGIWMYSLPDGKLLNYHEGNNTRKAAFSLDGTWLVASEFENINPPGLLNFNTAKWIFFTISNLNGKDCRQYAVSPDKRLIGQVCRRWEIPSRLELVDSSSGKLFKSIEFLTREPLSLAFNPTGTLVAVGFDTGEIVIIEVSTQKSIVTFQAQPSAVTSLTFSLDGRTLISTGDDGVVNVWGIP
jgi:WD40 repeat protein